MRRRRQYKLVKNCSYNFFWWMGWRKINFFINDLMEKEKEIDILRKMIWKKWSKYKEEMKRKSTNPLWRFTVILITLTSLSFFLSLLTQREKERKQREKEIASDALLFAAAGEAVRAAMHLLCLLPSDLFYGFSNYKWFSCKMKTLGNIFNL